MLNMPSCFAAQARQMLWLCRREGGVGNPQLPVQLASLRYGYDLHRDTSRNVSR